MAERNADPVGNLAGGKGSDPKEARDVNEQPISVVLRAVVVEVFSDVSAIDEERFQAKMSPLAKKGFATPRNKRVCSEK